MLSSPESADRSGDVFDIVPGTWRRAQERVFGTATGAAQSPTQAAVAASPVREPLRGAGSPSPTASAPAVRAPSPTAPAPSAPAPLVSALMVSAPGAAEVAFAANGHPIRIIASNPAELGRAEFIARRLIADLNDALSYTRSDSDAARLAAAEGPVRMEVSALFAEVLRRALEMSVFTDGIVDPTLGGVGAQGPLGRRLRVDQRNVVTGDRGVVLDLFTIGRAFAADRIAAVAAVELHGCFIVDVGGDLAYAGAGRIDPASLRPHPHNDATRALLATSRGGAACAQAPVRVLDPRTGETHASLWSRVATLAGDAVAARVAAAVSFAIAERAPRWLSSHSVGARLDAADGYLTVTPGWPAGLVSCEPSPAVTTSVGGTP